MSSELIEEGGAFDAGSDDALVTNGANETDEGVAEYLEEHDPMAAGKLESPSKRGRKARRPAEPDEVAEENVETLGDEEETEVIEHILEEVEEEEENEDEGDTKDVDQKPVLLKATQLPKKRKNVLVKQNSNCKIKVEEEEYVDDDEQPTSTAREAAKMENHVDENQCRVCTSKESLISLFKTINKQTIADKLMSICPTVSIAQKDFMPQFICNPCLDNVTIALELKTKCENTERELRKKLSRSKNKVRRPTGYVVIDATLDSDPSDEEPNDDVEFKVSDDGGITAEDDSDDSDFGTTSKKKRSPRGGPSRRGRRKSAAVTPAPKVKEKKRIGRPPTKRSLDSPPMFKEESSDDEEESHKKIKKRKIKSSPPSAEQVELPSEFPCDECEQVFSRKLSLILHKKVHMQREPLKCEVCGQMFKIQGAYRKHVQKHNEEPAGFECNKCEYVGSSKAELRRHLVDEHDEQGILYQCEKCKRKFVSEARLEKHQDGRCPGQERPPKSRPDMDSFAVGKDLFKSVAPLTTTYWSDSFSD
ncbi:putative zinc finger and SCAN domain-containing protein 5D [Ceratitis capitata]|uniref:putative zinc finger and SCAN domain-containing protein 5D n=1 Tax=Ceratitis capitata TaxID=7213 RepID=UPI00032A14E3|nr:putative zinc finger and SCAN domain-containing protein 5D [Ceratitis capitata]